MDERTTAAELVTHECPFQPFVLFRIQMAYASRSNLGLSEGFLSIPAILDFK